MYGSVVVRKVLTEQLPLIPEVVAAVSDRMHGGAFAPQGWAYPFVVYYAQPGTAVYGGAIGHGAPSDETLTLILRFIDQNTGIGRIYPAAQAALAYFDGLRVSTTDGASTYDFTFNPTGEWPLTEYSDGGMVYQELGNTFGLTIYKR